ncbi:hypothetical protein C2E21_6339 [Chlorella sorokiniana]|uniref:Lysine methyltransferase METTL21D n=1 Tax=Chlorella sorokiniana TaxID=3076 RepID=A0A2P6TLS3_CHLSO|nr:hypothetical protein C2E21_6339 [Chlorella sorokiniana]|eukprot:PRW45241.1 hypothetical protein C2E21_6339 [Chlorella sorokiniana]
MLERWNTHFSTTVNQELFGIDFQLAQDPNSSNLGTTVWDASIVLAKYIEKNSRRGDFSRPKVRGKRALELGAGMGLAGMALALLGAEVVFTDIGDVLPLLRRNVEQNISPAALKLRDAGWAASEVGRTSVASLDWSDRSCYADFKPPYDFILAADCVYSELAVPHLLATVLAMGGPRTQAIITNEFRSQTVHDEFMAQFGRHFTIRKVAAGKMDANYQHPLIHIYLLKRRKEPLQDGDTSAAAEEGADAAAATTADAVADAAGQQAAGAAAEPATAGQGDADVPGPAAAAVAAGSSSSGAAQSVGLQAAAEGEPGSSQPGGSQGGAEEAAQQLQAGTATSPSGRSSERAAAYQQQFQTRRQGAMLARLLKDVKLGGGSEP